MMAYCYSGLVVGILSLAAGLASGSNFLVALGLACSVLFGIMAWRLRRRRRDGFSVP